MSGDHEDHGHDDHAAPVSTASDTPTLGGTPKWIGWIITGAFVVLLILFLFIWKPWKSENGESNTKKDNSKTSSDAVVKKQYTEFFVLHTGNPETHPIPIGYKPEFSGGGKMYYLRIDDKPEVLLPQSDKIDFGDHNQEFTIRKHESEKVVKIMVTYIPYN